MRSLVTLVLLVFSFQVSAAATTTSSSYVIEVLVIQHVDEDDGGEFWINREGKNRADKTEKETESSKPVVVNDTPPTDSKLTKVATLISEDKNYRILAHKRWYQFAEPRSNSKQIRINGAENTEPVLDGTLLIYSTRYLHIIADLSLRDKQSNVEEGEEAKEGEEVGPVYRIREKRRIRIKQINYFDHPKFGLLVYVAPRK